MRVSVVALTRGRDALMTIPEVVTIREMWLACGRSERKESVRELRTGHFERIGEAYRELSDLRWDGFVRI